MNPQANLSVMHSGAREFGDGQGAETLFGTQWLHVGRTAELAGPDSVVTRRIGVARAELLLTRDAYGVLHGFRADGRRSGAPGVRFPHRPESGLRPVAVGACAGFLFVNLAPVPARSLRGFLGPLAGVLEGLGLPDDTGVEQHRVDLEADWRTALDGARTQAPAGPVHHLAPNLLLQSRGAGTAVTTQFWPLTAGRTRMIVRRYGPGAGAGAAVPPGATA